MTRRIGWRAFAAAILGLTMAACGYSKGCVSLV